MERERYWCCSACEHVFEVDEDSVLTYPDGMEFTVCPVCYLNVFLSGFIQDGFDSVSIL